MNKAGISEEEVLELIKPMVDTISNILKTIRQIENRIDTLSRKVYRDNRKRIK